MKVMTFVIYDLWTLWNAIYDFCNYDKRIMKNIFMTKVLWLLLLRLMGYLNRFYCGLIHI